jgi:LysM repeat protein
MIPSLVARRSALVLVLGAVVVAVVACGPGSTPMPTLPPAATLRPSPSRTVSPASPTVRAPASPTRAPTPVVTAAPTGQAYTIQKGDTLAGIAATFGVTLEALRAANPQVTDPTKLQIGQVLTIPAK